MSHIFITGCGVVSSAGWNLDAMRTALRRGIPIEEQSLPRIGSLPPLRIRPTPPPTEKLALLASPRLRRASMITQHAAAASKQALEQAGLLQGTPPRLGIIFCMQSGCVQYSYRFFDEALKDPATASPLLFPETVFAAPVSHLAAVFSGTRQVMTLVGDPSCFLQGLAYAASWIEEGVVDHCLVIGAEESNWLLADALHQFEDQAVFSHGAGVLCLSRKPEINANVTLDRVTSAHTYQKKTSVKTAAYAMKAELPECGPREILVDGLKGYPTLLEKIETELWQDWKEARLSPKKILGEGLMAATAWQCVAAYDALTSDGFAGATVSMLGCNQQAIGARFAKLT